MSEPVNPYAAPTASVDNAEISGKEAIRREHLNHEASIRAVGLLYYLGGVLVVVAAFAGPASAEPAFALGLLVVGVAQVVGGWAVRAFLPWGRNLGCVLSVIGLFGFPIGTVINGYILYLFLSKKGRTVFTPEYQEVIASTPEIKYRTSIIVWIFLAVLAGLLLLGLGVALLGR